MLTFVCWKWQTPGYRSTFRAEHVLTLRRMIKRHYQPAHRFVCVTDDASGLDDVETIPLWDDLGNVPNPLGRHNPSCYRRLKLFAPDAGEVFGEYAVSIDLDMVIVNDIEPLFRGGEDFKIWGQSDYPRTQWYNGSLWSLRTGTRTKVWTEFDPKTSPQKALKAGKKGSDQGWLNYILPKEAMWSTKDGVYSCRVHIAKNKWRLPSDARIVAFHGKVDPWSYQAQQIEWVREYYR